MPAPTIQPPSYREALRVWAYIAINSFGGPAGQIAVMHRVLVDEKRWISEKRFLHALNYCMLLPGPEAQQLAVYVGWLFHGVRGGITAGLLFILPGIVSILALSFIYVSYQEVHVVQSAFFGLKAAVLAVVVEAVLRIGKRALKARWQVALAVMAFCAIFFFNLPFPMIIAGAALIGLARRKITGVEAKSQEDTDHTTYAADASLHGEAAALPALSHSIKTVAVWGTLWLAPRACALPVAWPRFGLFSDRLLLQPGGRGHLWRSLRGAGLHSTVCGGSLPVDAAGRDDGRTGAGRNHPGSTHHGGAIRGIHRGGAPRRHAAPPIGGHARGTLDDVGHFRTVLPLDIPRRALHRGLAPQPRFERRALRNHSGGRWRHT